MITDGTYLDGRQPVPLSPLELDGVRAHLDLYYSTDLVARLMATIDDDDDEPIVGVPV